MSPLGNEDARAQVGTKGGLSQRWRESLEDLLQTSQTLYAEMTSNLVPSKLDDARSELRSSMVRAEAALREMDAAKLRIEEAVKALPAYLHHGDTGPLSVSSRTAVLKIIREIL